MHQPPQPSSKELPTQQLHDQQQEINVLRSEVQRLTRLVNSALISLPSATALKIEVKELRGSLNEMRAILPAFRDMQVDISRLQRSEGETRRAIQTVSGQFISSDATRIAERVELMETYTSRQKQDIERILSTIYDPAGEFELLNEQVRAVRDSVTVGNGVQKHGIKFSHPSKIAAVLRTCKAGIAIFHDAVSLLHSIGAASVSHKDTLATMKAQRDVKMSSDLEARVITSFHTNLQSTSM